LNAVRAPRESETRLVDDVADDAAPEEIAVTQGAWQLFEDETVVELLDGSLHVAWFGEPKAETEDRLSSAQERVYTTYFRRLQDRGFVAVARAENADAILANVEETLAKRAAEAPPELEPELFDAAEMLSTRPKVDAETERGSLCACTHGDEHHPAGGACEYGKDAKYDGCDCQSYRPYASPAAKHARHDARVEEIIRKRQARLAARDAANTAIVQALEQKPKEGPVPQPSRIEEVFVLVEKGVARSADIAERLGMQQGYVGQLLRQLVEARRVENVGTRATSRFYVKGTAPTSAAVVVAKPATSQKKTRTVSPTPLKVVDVSHAPATSRARFVVNIEGLPVECSTAAEVLELAREFKKGT
jgi:hypothetical protein